MAETRGRTQQSVYVAAAILASTGLYACWCDAAMIWDGAYQYCCTLLYQNPFSYGTRFHSYLAWLPVVWVNRVTDSPPILRAVYGLPYLLAPAAGLLLSWWVVRRRAPELIIWAAFGVAIAPLPGQIFVINDSIFQIHLFWPLFMGALVPLDNRRLVALSLLAVFQLSHPIGIALLLGTLGAACLLLLAKYIARPLANAPSAALPKHADQGPYPLIAQAGRPGFPSHDNVGKRRSYVAILFLFLVSAVLKNWRFPDQYAAQEMDWIEVVKRWRDGVMGAPLSGLWFMWIAGLLLFVQARLGTGPSRIRRLLPAAVPLAVACAAGYWIPWAADQHAWYKALDWRRWVVPLTMPFFVLAFAEAWAQTRRQARDGAAATGPQPSRADDGHATEIRKLRGVTGIALALVFAAVLSVQSTIWSRMTDRLVADVGAHPSALVPMSDIPWTYRTAMDHWGTPAYLVALQGARQEKLLWVNDAYRRRSHVLVPTATPQDPRDMGWLAHRPPQVPVTEWSVLPSAPNAKGWFDFGPFIEGLHRQDAEGKGTAAPAERSAPDATDDAARKRGGY